MSLKADLRAELKEYMKTIGELSVNEKQDLRIWVSEGNSVHENPFLISGEDGWPMDYINASRFSDEMYEDHINGTNLIRSEFEQDGEDNEPGIPF